jgi:hypothetical protein
MGRYMVIWKGRPASLEALEQGNRMWRQALGEFPDIHGLRLFGNLIEGHLFGVLEAPSGDRIRELDQRVGQLCHESGMMPAGGDFEMGLEIIPLEFEYDGEKLVYQHELVRVC